MQYSFDATKIVFQVGLASFWDCLARWSQLDSGVRSGVRGFKFKLQRLRKV